MEFISQWFRTAMAQARHATITRRQREKGRERERAMAKKGTMRGKRDRRNAIGWKRPSPAQEALKRDAVALGAAKQTALSPPPPPGLEEAAEQAAAVSFQVRVLERLFGLASPPARGAGGGASGSGESGGTKPPPTEQRIGPHIWGVCSCCCPPQLRGPSGFATARVIELMDYPIYWAIEYCRGWNKFPRRRYSWMWNNAVSTSPGVRRWANHCPLDL